MNEESKVYKMALIEIFRKKVMRRFWTKHYSDRAVRTSATHTWYWRSETPWKCFNVGILSVTIMMASRFIEQRVSGPQSEPKLAG